MKKLLAELKVSGLILFSVLIFACEKTTNEPKIDNNLDRLATTSYTYDPCKGKCCAFSQGYWFSKPNVIWPGNLDLGCQTYTKAEGQAIWDAVKGSNNSSLFKAFFQVGAIVLSGTPESCAPHLKKYVVGTHNILCSLPKITPANLDALSASITSEQERFLQQAAGRIGEWIDANHCK